MTDRPAGCGCYGTVVCRLCQRAGLPVAPPPAPCAHRGEPLTASECVALGLPPTKSWAMCWHPDQPKGIFVCPCRGCGTGCSGYSTETGDG